MKSRYKITQASCELYRAGVSYHNFGTVTQGKQKMFDFFAVDKITTEQLEKIKQFCHDVKVIGGHSEYAPELKRVNILFPKAAFYRSKAL